MTSFTKAQIPNDLTTVEQLTAWCLEVLAFSNPDGTVITAPGTADLAVRTGVDRFPLNTDRPIRFIGGCYLPRSADAGTRAVWLGCTELTPGQLPQQFRQSGT